MAGQCLEGQGVLVHPLDQRTRKDWNRLEARWGVVVVVWTFEEEEEEAN